MIVYNNQEPNAVNNVGQFGATEGSIGAYKQAAEYAADAKYWALLAESKFGTVDDLIAEVEKLYKQGILLQQDIEDLKQDFRDQDARLMQLIAQTNAAVANANNSIALINQKLIEVDQQLDILLAMKVTVTTLPPGSEATGSFNNQTGEIKLGIPEGEPGRDGSVTDLNTAPSGTPVLGDIGFYVDVDDNKVYKTTLNNIANLIPSVRSIKVNGGPEQTGDVALTIDKNTVGLGSVLDVAQYSRREIDDKFDKPIKIYQTKAEADANAQFRQIGESVMVWENTQYVFYTVAANKTLTPAKTEGRIITVNSKSPDSSGNIDITIPTGNPSLYLGEMVMFPYDPAKSVSYPGVLPADGRLVPKENASDLGPSLVSGQLPVVSETEWQNGSKQYFSWGKLADGITDADSTNFINIRLPDWTGGESIRAPDSDKDSQYDGTVQSQKPYIVTVNNQAPDDATGNVNISKALLGAASSGANSDITSITGLTTALSVSQGGTGSNNSGGARINLDINRFVQKSNETQIVSPDNTSYLSVSNDRWGVFDLSSGTWRPLDIAQGGTGAVTAAAARTNLGLGSVSILNNIPVSQGGTGATDAAEARTNLGLGSVSTFNTVPIASGGTGATNAATARTNLGVGSTQQVEFGKVSLSTVVSGPYGAGYTVTVSGGDYGAQYSNPVAMAVTCTESERYINLATATVPGVGNPGGIDCYMGANGSSFFRLHSGASSYVFSNNGSATAPGTWISTSDIRLKKRLVEIDSATEKLSLLKGYTYLKRNTLAETDDTEYHEEAGLIAQDVFNALPEAVYDVGQDSGVDYQGVSYSGITALLVNGFNEQVEIIKSMRAEIDELRSIISQSSKE